MSADLSQRRLSRPDDLRKPAVASALCALALVFGPGCGDGGVESGGPPPGTPPDDRAPLATSYAPWPGALHDPRHSSTSASEGPAGGEVLWRRRLEGPVVPGPAIGRGGTIYAASNGGILHAFDPNGRELWSFDGGSGYGSDLSTTPAITRGGTILWPGPGGLYALDPQGKLLWRWDSAATVLSPLLADPVGRKVYAMTMDGSLTALATKGGKPRELWSSSLGSVSYSSPALAADGTIYAGAGDSLFAVEARDGTTRWHFSTDDLIEVSPAVAPDGTVVIGSNDATVRGIDPTGAEVWRHDLGEITYSSPAVSGGIAYVGDHSGAVSALDAADGTPVARYAGQGRTDQEVSVGVWTAPAIDSGGRVYFGSRLGHIYGFTAGGKQLFDVETGATVDSYPALSRDGTLVIGSEDGYLYAIGA